MVALLDIRRFMDLPYYPRGLNEIAEAGWKVAGYPDRMSNPSTERAHGHATDPETDLTQCHAEYRTRGLFHVIDQHPNVLLDQSSRRPCPLQDPLVVIHLLNFRK